MLGFFDKRQGMPSLMGDLRSGDAGGLPRIAMSVAAAAAIVALVMLGLGIVDHGDNVHIRDDHVAIALLMSVAPWLLSLRFVWGGYRGRRNLLLAIFGVVAIWAVTIPVCVLIDMKLRGADFLIAATIFSAICGTLTLITTSWYRHKRGRPLETQEGHVNVNCPTCGYSLVGLYEPRCPECGARFTIDELIRRQDFAAVRKSHSQDAPPIISPVTQEDNGGSPSENRELSHSRVS